ncbi:MAG: energy transducer TonB [Prevotellaceae bacterium]|jgi:protein TonB|nr:energy transducer TonB [Prevotellaceae bacterium]
MELKKTRKADIQNKKFLFFEIALSLSLLAVLVSFEWASKDEIKETVLLQNFKTIIEEEEFIPITQTHLSPQELPQIPQIPEEINIVENDVEVFSGVDFSNIEADKDVFQIFGNVGTVVQQTNVPEEDIIESVPFVLVENKPKFQGKDAESFRDWILDKIGGYPQVAQENGITGVVYVSFVINTDGSLSDIKSTRKVDPILSDIVLAAVKESPKWTPGSQQNKPVKVPYVLPIVFKLQN